MTQTYNIIIDEEQREALLELLKRSPADPRLEYWIEMLEALPRDEAAHPDVLHGFCL